MVKLRIGCNIGGIFLNLFAYADDMVLIAPSWFALQKLLVAIQDEASSINMSFSTKKTVCMVFNPVQKCKVVASTFPRLTLAGCELSYLDKFKYLGQIIEKDLSDNSDINKEIKCLYTRTNIMMRRFHRCSVRVKLQLFRTYCTMCFYDAALWLNFNVQTMKHFQSCYIKCIKNVFGYQKYHSVTAMLLEL